MDYPVYYQNWSEAVLASLQKVWFQVADFLPHFLGALIVLIIGVLIAKALGKIVKTIIIYTKADIVLQKIGLKDDLIRMGIPGSFAGFIGGIVKWFIIIITLLAVVDILRIEQLSVFLQSVLQYIPHVVVAVIILGIGVVGGKFLHTMIERAGSESVMIGSARGALSGLAKWSVIIFALMAALVELGIASSLIQILFTGIVTLLTIAGGLAFGLGGRDAAREWIAKMSAEFKPTHSPAPQAPPVSSEERKLV